MKSIKGKNGNQLKHYLGIFRCGLYLFNKVPFKIKRIKCKAMREKAKRFFKYMEYKGLNDHRVTIACDLGCGFLKQVRAGKSDFGTKSIDKILNTYQDSSRAWFRMGEGGCSVVTEMR